MVSRRLWSLVALLSLVGCLEPDDPIPVQAQPGYYASGHFVALSIDPTNLILDTDLPAEPLVNETLHGLGPIPDSVTSYSALAHHWRVWLPVGTSATTAETAARRLRVTAGVRFASTGYFVAGSGGCRLTLLNRLAVMYRAGVSRAAIDALNARVGTTVRPDGLLLGGAWTLAYPVGTTHTPLEIAAYYASQSLVEWVDPDKVGCVTIN